jgi:hypothetical protein
MRFSLRLKKLALALATFGCLVGAGAVLNWGLSPTVPVNPGTAAMVKRTTVNTHPLDTAEPTPQDFLQLWGRPLRRPLYDPPPPKPEVKELPPLQLELLGTIIEPPNSIAIIRSGQGSSEYKRIGDQLGPADSPASLIEIGPSEIVVERSGQRITLGVQSRNVR